MCISEPIQEMASPQSSVTIDPLLHYSGLQVDEISTMTSIGGQQEMVIDNDGPETNDNDKPVIEPSMEENKANKDKAKQSQQSQPPNWTGAPGCPRLSTPTCTFSPSAPQVEYFVLYTEPPAGNILPCTMVDPDMTTEDQLLKAEAPHKERRSGFPLHHPRFSAPIRIG